MSTRIEVNVEGSGLAGRNRQQIAANRQAQAERELRARAEARARVQREEFLASQGLNPDGSPNAEYQNLRRGRFVGDDPAANRSGVNGFLCYAGTSTTFRPLPIPAYVQIENILHKDGIRASNIYDKAIVDGLNDLSLIFISEAAALYGVEINPKIEPGNYGTPSIRDSGKLNFYIGGTLPIAAVKALGSESTNFTIIADLKGDSSNKWSVRFQTLTFVVELFVYPPNGETKLLYSVGSKEYSIAAPLSLLASTAWTQASMTVKGSSIYFHVNGILIGTINDTVQEDLGDTNRLTFRSAIEYDEALMKPDPVDSSMGVARLIPKAVFGPFNYAVRPILKYR